MNETKSVKVDNWGVFFLQKLQNFFNRTDYCDLTLQFNDNSQLKVHRLVLSACTDYFNLLEQQCEMIDDILIMPDELQADVVVPIVNFMYTGTLEFQYNMFDKLLKTAKDMNMTVLLKLLEAHHLATRNIRKPANPVVLNKQAPRNILSSTSSYSTTGRASAPTQVVKRVVRGGTGAQSQKVVFKHHQTTIAPVVGTKVLPEPVQVIAKYSHAVPTSRGPTRFEVDDQTLEGFEEHFDSISYESKPLLTAEQIKKEEESSTFEQLKKDVTIKRPPPSSLASPPAKKPNLDDVKELTENIRLRKQLAGEEMEEEADEYFDDTPFDDDDDEVQPVNKSSNIAKSYGQQAVTKTVGISSSPKTTISIKEEGGNVNHAKIISEVLKKYPHLVKNNKNIKLKIMQKGSEGTTTTTTTVQRTPPTAKVYPTKITTTNQQAAKAIQKISPQVKVEQKPIVIPPAAPNKPRRIDAKTMHELIAKGAENTTGPWLCLRCGIDGRPISIPSYKGFRRHLITVHKEKIDPKLCEECGYKSTSRNDLHYHLLVKHEIQHPKDIKFPKCNDCNHIAATQAQLQKHVQEEHVKTEGKIQTIQQCCYCDKVFIKETTLMSHIKQYHRDQAREDGVIEDDEHGYIPNNPNADTGKIKVLSNVPLSKGIQFVIDPTSQPVTQIGGKSTLITTSKLEPSSEADALSKVASGIATSLTLVGTGDIGLEEHYPQELQQQYMSGDTKILTEDGTELQLTQSQKDEILSQLQNADGNNVIMILNQDTFEHTPVVTSEASGNIVVYSQANDTQPMAGLMTTTAICTNQEAPIIVNAIPQDEMIKAEAEECIDFQKPEENEAETHENIQKEIEATQIQPDIQMPEPMETETEEQPTELTDTNQSDIEMKKLENDTNDSLEQEMVRIDAKDGSMDEAEKAKASLISTLQGDWTEESEDEAVSVQKVEQKKLSKEATPDLEPALFEDLEKKSDEHETTDTKIADAVDDLLNELEEEFDEKKAKVSDSLDENETNGKDKDDKSDGKENKELSKLMDDWDDDDL